MYLKHFQLHIYVIRSVLCGKFNSTLCCSYCLTTYEYEESQNVSNSENLIVVVENVHHKQETLHRSNKLSLLFSSYTLFIHFYTAIYQQLSQL